MGYNSSTYDKEAHFKAMSVRKLMDIVQYWTDAQERNKNRYDDFAARHNLLIERELEYCRMKLAERIGKK